MLTFTEKDHKYSSVDIFDQTKWVSASTIPALFKKKFDEKATALKCSGNKKSKWYGIPPAQILDIWKTENVRSTTEGTWYHNKDEQRLLSLEFEHLFGKDLPIFRSVWQDGVKQAPDQKLAEGIYPEHLAYLSSVGACGQFDKIIIVDGYCHVDDHKTNKDLLKPAFTNWEGITEKFLPPLLHLDCHKLNEYALQLSIGMYMILRHNPHLKPGKQILNHVVFEVAGENEWGYPITKLDENGEPIIKEVNKIEVPYLKREVELMFEFLKRRPKNV